MRNSILLSAFVIASAVAFIGCNKEIAPEESNENKVHFTINATAPETKTFIEYDSEAGTYTPKWHSGDALGVFFNTWAEDAALGTTFTNTLSDGVSASFSGEGTVDVSEQTIYAFYPSSAFAKAYSSHVIGLTIPGTQKPTATSFDKTADLLVNKPYPITISNTSVVIDDMQFTRILSTLKLTITDGTGASILSSDRIKSITLTTKTSDDLSGESLVGRYQWDFENEEGAMNVSVKSNSVTADLSANPIALDGTSPIYLMVSPTTLPKDSKLLIDISTDKHEISKTATLSAKAFEFPAGQVARLNISIKDTDTIEEAIAEPTGTGWYQVKDASWLKAGDKIVITNAGSTQALGSQNSTNRAYTAVSLTGEKLNVGTAAQLTLVTGSKSGTFALKDGVNYLNAVDDQNYLKSEATEVTDISSWTITANKTSAKIFNVSLTSREIQQNKTNSLFSTYKSTQNPILIYKQYSLPELGDISISLTPDHANKSITVTWTDVANATNYEVTCIGKEAQNIASGVEEAIFSGLEYDTEYTITVTASAAGYASSSDSKTQTLVNPAAKTITRLKESITDVVAAGTTATETGVYSLTNASDSDLTPTPDGTVVTSASVSGGSLTYTVAPNTGAARDGSVTISVAGGNSIVVTIRQLSGITWITEVFPSSGTRTSYAGDLTVEGEKLTWYGYGTCARNSSDTAFAVSEALTMGKSDDNTSSTNYSYANFQSSVIAGGISKLKFEYMGNSKAFRVEVVVGSTVVWSKDGFTATTTKQSSGELTVTGATSNAVIRFVNTSGARRVTVGNISWQ